MYRNNVLKKFWWYWLFAIPIIFQISFYIYSNEIFFHKIQKEPIDFGAIHHAGEAQVHLWGIYGDAFDPKAKGVDFDVVIISATLDPFAVIQGEFGSIIIWQQNNLLHSALINTFPDPEAFREAVRELVVYMGQNGNLVALFLGPEYKVSNYKLRELTHVYVWDVPNPGVFFNKTRINAIIAVPIFDPKFMYQEIDNLDVVHARLRDNVFVVIQRAVKEIGDIEKTKPYSIHTIAIPALAGTCCRLDSWLYLDYQTSYFTIAESLESSKIPSFVDRIYLIVYDKLPPIERVIALNALFQVYRYYKMRYWLDFKNFPVQGPILRALIWIIPFYISILLTHRRWKQVLRNPATRRSFFLGSVALGSIYTGIIIPLNEISLSIAKRHFLYLIALYVILGISSAYGIGWLNARVGKVSEKA